MEFDSISADRFEIVMFVVEYVIFCIFLYMTCKSSVTLDRLILSIHNHSPYKTFSSELAKGAFIFLLSKCIFIISNNGIH